MTPESRSYLRFVETLVARHAVLQPAFAEHLCANGEILAWVFFGDVARVVVECTRDAQTLPIARAIIFDLESALAHASPDGGLDEEAIDNLIHVSFLENLPYPDEEGAAVVDLLPPRLRAGLRMIRGEP